MNFHTTIQTFDQLTTRELYAILALRSRIFVVEQNCAYQDPDGEADFRAVHLTVWQAQNLAAYLRIIPAHDKVPTKIGRVAVAPEFRGCGLARQIMQSALSYCQSQGIDTVFLQAQIYLTDFYRSFGFTAISEPYLEDSIPHINMLLENLSA